MPILTPVSLRLGEGACDGDHGALRLPFIPHFWHTGLLMTTRYVYIHASFATMPSSCTAPGSVTMPWQPTVTPAALPAHAPSPSSYPPSSARPPHVSPAPRLCADALRGRTCERVSIASPWPPQLGHRHGDGGDNVTMSNVIKAMALRHVQTSATEVQKVRLPIIAPPIGCQPFPFPIIFFFL